MPHPVTTARPAHLTFVALVLIVWHAALAADYLNLRFALVPDAPQVMSLLPFQAIWAHVAWAMTVWLGLAGALFLLWRDDAAVLLLFTAAVTMVVALAGLAGIVALPALAEMPLAALVPALVIVPLGGCLYARGLKRAAVLH
ncbi:MAG: hypothetical protein JJU19_02775 [Pararhodobacter sp.]|nr:hypothetical protein [Pararhodobacter sp.]